VEQLRLVRGEGDTWRLPKDEVERTAKAGGLELPQPAPPGMTSLVLFVAVTAVLGVAVLAWQRMRRGRSIE
jgi:hypothetical protein